MVRTIDGRTPAQQLAEMIYEAEQAAQPHPDAAPTRPWRVPHRARPGPHGGAGVTEDTITLRLDHPSFAELRDALEAVPTIDPEDVAALVEQVRQAYDARLREAMDPALCEGLCEGPRTNRAQRRQRSRKRGQGVMR